MSASSELFMQMREEEAYQQHQEERRFKMLQTDYLNNRKIPNKEQEPRSETEAEHLLQFIQPIS